MHVLVYQLKRVLRSDLFLTQVIWACQWYDRVGGSQQSGTSTISPFFLSLVSSQRVAVFPTLAVWAVCLAVGEPGLCWELHSAAEFAMFF